VAATLGTQPFWLKQFRLKLWRRPPPVAATLGTHILVMVEGTDIVGDLTQTQPLFSQTQRIKPDPQVSVDKGVHARLVSLTDPRFRYEIRSDRPRTEILVGRHPECHVVANDKRVSAKHLRIYRDEAWRYFVEELSSNGCWINRHYMSRSETRALRHGDTVSLCVQADDVEQKPFASWIFRIVEDDRDSALGRVPPISEQPCDSAAREVPCSAAAGAAGVAGCVGTEVGAGGGQGGNVHQVTEEWVNNHWDMRTVLGGGNFSEVRLGVRVTGGEKCAVKVIHKNKFFQFQTKRESRLSLQSEAEVLMSLHHPGIVRFREWFETDAHLYLAMELLQGDLLQCILEDGSFPEVQARRHFQEVCGAVRYLHERHIVHRDLKPENILLTDRERDKMHLKITDFGLAWRNAQSRDCKTFCGTPHYFAPEVIKACGRPRDGGGTQPTGYGKEADMWSLGVILYVMISGVPPFEEDSLYEQILEGKYEFDVCEWTAVSPEAKQLVSQLMTVEQNHRLTVQQALQHIHSRWITGPASPQNADTDAVLPARVLDNNAIAAPGPPKRRRTEDDILASCATANLEVHQHPFGSDMEPA